jgi:hypothetical protein
MEIKDERHIGSEEKRVNRKSQNLELLTRLRRYGYFFSDIRGNTVSFSILRDIQTLMNEVYKDSWDFKWIKIGTKNYRVLLLIHYDEIRIFNHVDDDHLIKDLIVGLGIVADNSSGLFGINSIMGTKMHSTYREVMAGYMHSHLPVRNAIPDKRFLSNFCLGDADIADLQVEINSREVFEPEQFELFLHTLNSYLEYESLEGGPYITLETLKETPEFEGSNRSRLNVPIVNPEHIPEFLDCDVHFVANQFKVGEDSFAKELKKFVLAEAEYNHSFYKFLGTYTISGAFYYYTNLSVSTDIWKTLLVRWGYNPSDSFDDLLFTITIRDKELKYVVDEPTTSSDANIKLEDLTLNNHYLKVVKERYEKRILSQIIRNHLASQEAKIEDAREYLTQDTVSV